MDPEQGTRTCGNCKRRSLFPHVNEYGEIPVLQHADVRVCEKYGSMVRLYWKACEGWAPIEAQDWGELAGSLLAIIGMPQEMIPRFRDVWVDVGSESIVIHTRTGGGNREEYQEENQKMAKHPGYRFDRDDDFDCTYADFFYEIPERYRDSVLLFGKEGVPPAKKWQDLLCAMSSDPENPMVEEVASD